MRKDNSPNLHDKDISAKQKLKRKSQNTNRNCGMREGRYLFYQIQPRDRKSEMNKTGTNNCKQYFTSIWQTSIWGV